VQLVVQLRSVFAEYGLSRTNIDGRHCDTVMPSTTTARRANTTIEAHTHSARISLPGLKEPRRANNQYSGWVTIPVQSRPVCPNCDIGKPSGLDTCSISREVLRVALIQPRGGLTTRMRAFCRESRRRPPVS
jgi:hypothetical protein